MIASKNVKTSNLFICINEMQRDFCMFNKIMVKINIEFMVLFCALIFFLLTRNFSVELYI